MPTIFHALACIISLIPIPIRIELLKLLIFILYFLSFPNDVLNNTKPGIFYDNFADLFSFDN